MLESDSQYESLLEQQGFGGAEDHYIFGFGPQLWDASPDVCCAAFQLGACIHTESPEFEQDCECGGGPMFGHSATCEWNGEEYPF